VSNPLRAYDAMVHDYSYAHMVEYDMLRFQETLHTAPLSAALRSAQQGKNTSYLPRVRIFQSAKVCGDITIIDIDRCCVGGADVEELLLLCVLVDKSCWLIRTLSGAA
jgi:hypothetical protein